MGVFNRGLIGLLSPILGLGLIEFRIDSGLEIFKLNFRDERHFVANLSQGNTDLRPTSPMVVNGHTIRKEEILKLEN